MKTLHTNLIAATIAATFGAAGVSPAAAVPLPLSKASIAAPSSDVIQVDRRWRRGYHNGYRGYHHYRSGYRYYDGWWFPAGAFVAGALIGGAIANNNYYGGYYGGYYGSSYYGDGYYPRYYPRYYERASAYYPPRSSYRAGYRDGYRDGYYARRYYNDITCTPRLQDAGKC